jgi:hypothetical protein
MIITMYGNTQRKFTHEIEKIHMELKKYEYH